MKPTLHRLIPSSLSTCYSSQNLVIISSLFTRPYFVRRLAAPFRAKVHHGRFGWRRINGVQFFSSFLFPLIAARFRQRRFASRGHVRRKVDRSMRKTLVVIAAHLVDSSGKLKNEELSVMNETSQFITIVKWPLKSLLSFFSRDLYYLIPQLSLMSHLSINRFDRITGWINRLVDRMNTELNVSLSSHLEMALLKEKISSCPVRMPKDLKSMDFCWRSVLRSKANWPNISICILSSWSVAPISSGINWNRSSGPLSER